MGVLKVWQEIGEKTAWTTYSSVLLDCCALHSEPKLSKKSIVQLDNFVYDVFLMIAKGHRGIPVAALEAQPYRVTHVLSLIDIVDLCDCSCLIASHHHETDHRGDEYDETSRGSASGFGVWSRAADPCSKEAGCCSYCR